MRRSPEGFVRRPVFIGAFSALVRRQRILDEDALAEGQELDSNILLSPVRRTRIFYRKRCRATRRGHNGQPESSRMYVDCGPRGLRRSRRRGGAVPLP